MKKILFFISLVSISSLSFAQQGPQKWTLGGNSIGTGDFLGTTNNFDLRFKVNSALKMTLSTNGTLLLNNFSGSGSGLVTYDNNGALVQVPFASPADVLYGNGTFGPINFSGSGWTANGNDLFYNGSGNVGIGTNTPAYKLDVYGNIRVTGTVFTSGVLISNQVQAGTASLGAVDATASAVSGTSTVGGNFGIGTTNPSAKLDVFGNANVSGDVNAGNLNVTGVSTFTNKIQTRRIMPLPGDSEIHFGDSSIVIVTNYNQIRYDLALYPPVNPVVRRGLLIGNTGQASRLLGKNTVGIGDFLGSDPLITNSIILGNGAGANLLRSTISNSLWVGFNSDVPTFFVGTSNGVGTTGNVGIGTNAPNAKLEVNGDPNSLLLSVGPIHPPNFPISDYLRVYGSGKVSIGVDITNMPGSYRLYVAGGILTEKVRVALANSSDWMDAVGTPGYYLPLFESQLNYFHQYHHMMDVPSADSLVKTGIDLGKMDATLLKKIEEGYLYMEKMNEKNNVLEKKIDVMEKEIELLQEENKELKKRK